MNSPPPFSIILLIDGLSPRYLAPWGCTWIETPALNRLAADSIVFENAIADSVDPSAALHSLLTGQHPLALDQPFGKKSNLFQPVRQAATTILLTDDAALFDRQWLESSFDEVIQAPESGYTVKDFRSRIGNNSENRVAFPNSCESGYVQNESAVADASIRAAREIADTHMAGCFALLGSEIANRELPLSVVFHLTSMTRRWDAPREIRQLLRDEDDPPPGPWTVPPDNIAKPSGPDPDDVFRIARALAAQVQCLDVCVGTLVDQLEMEKLLDSSLLAIAGLRGFPVGHHGIVGNPVGHLKSDAIDVAALVRLPRTTVQYGWREHRLTQPSQVFRHIIQPVISPSAAPPVDGASMAFADAVVLDSGAMMAIRTPAWLLNISPNSRQLFVKPDDLWDVNSVEDRCPGIVESLVTANSLCRTALENGERPARGTLATELMAQAD